ncbi:hypothetical protein BP5796_12624 [Coleophoma crateriformis]|uniref:Uncharacterized protein n=1 Tax=Coleophoma crateriformis TaxID=565419 RepID=A0A3D8Q7M1_9HELO|nr:hypothetical protein BP5796_12624 [Coleophoma crateriformis]
MSAHPSNSASASQQPAATRQQPAAVNPPAVGNIDNKLYDPALGSIHVMDISRDITLHRRRVSDLVVGMLWYANINSVITQTDVCEFRTVFLPQLKLRAGRIHEGQPFLGPDGLVVSLRGDPYNGGDARLGVSPLNTRGTLTHPNYDRWLSTLLFAGGERYDSAYHRALVAKRARSLASATPAPTSASTPTRSIPAPAYVSTPTHPSPIPAVATPESPTPGSSIPVRIFQSLKNRLDFRSKVTESKEPRTDS